MVGLGMAYDNLLVSNVLPTRPPIDKKRSETHHNHSTAPLHDSSEDLEGTQEGGGD